MSRRRRRRRSSGSGKQGSQQGSQQRSRQRSRDRSRGDSNRERTRERGARPDGPGFWGDPSLLPEPRTDLQMTDDPHAVPRSLGEPPLPGKREIAEHYFAAIYERAVQTAGALAAAGGLIDFERLANGGGEPDDD